MDKCWACDSKGVIEVLEGINHKMYKCTCSAGEKRGDIPPYPGETSKLAAVNLAKSKYTGKVNVLDLLKKTKEKILKNEPLDFLNEVETKVEELTINGFMDITEVVKDKDPFKE